MRGKALIAGISIGVILLMAGSAQSEDMDKILKLWKKKSHYAEAVCEQSLGDFDECMDRQFNCFVEMGNMYGISQAVTKKAKREAAVYNREGEVKAIDFCELKRKARIYDAQEKLEEAQRSLK